MSLSNPNSVVTEERLAGFYQGLLPYLGGMPTMVANKFSRSDIYSTEEKMIGQWTDGKPLYKKTFVEIVNPNTSTTIYYKNMVNNIAQVIEHTVLGQYLYTGSENYRTGLSPLPLTGSNGVIASYDNKGTFFDTPDGTGQLTGLTLKNSHTSKNVEFEITIWYTKTTDSAISIGSDTDYSTTEKIVGTWIDGKPIYQITITSTIPNCSTSGTSAVRNVNLGFTIDTLVDNHQVVKATPFQTALPLYAGDEVSYSVRNYIGNNTTLVIRNASTTYNGYTTYVTLQYTKTTD